MKKLFCLLLVAAVVLPATDALARKRHHVRIHKRPPHASTQPVHVVVPLVGFDLIRRSTCDPRVALTGGPGFEEKYGGTGNWLVPAIYRSQCKGTHPKWYGW